jgi:O-succinylbenzoate synthase
MIHLRSVTLREIRLSLREPFITSAGEQHVRRIFLIELEDADGTVSWSECVAQEQPTYTPETIDTAWHTIRTWLAPILLGNTLRPMDASALMNERVRGHEMAKAGLEMGLWALSARRSGRSLANLLGGTRKRVPAGISIGIQQSPAVLLETVRTCRAEGYRKIKVKIKPGMDIDFLRPIREELGDTVPLAADANSAYRLSDLEALRSLDDLGMLMIEQPLQHDDLVRHADLQRHLSTPICLDESITNRDRAEDMVRLRSGRIVNLKPGRVSGFAEALAIHDVCADNNVPVWCGGMLESGIGRAYNVALASLPNFSLPGDLSPSRRYWERDIVVPEWTMSTSGEVDVPIDVPGIGVEVDVDRVDDLTERIEKISA